MKIVAIFQFYLPYVLIRNPEWPDKYISLRFIDYVVDVRPRAPYEVIFPTDTDRKLFDWKVKIADRIPYLAGEAYFSIREKCFDRIEAKVHIEVGSVVEFRNEELQHEIWNSAINGANIFLLHCRVQTKDISIKLLEQDYSFSEQKLLLINPYSISWINEETNEPISFREDGKTQMVSTGNVRMPITKMVQLENVMSSLRTGQDPYLPMILLTDAASNVGNTAVREGILLLGTACEVAFNLYLSSYGYVSIDQLESIAPRNLPFAERRYHLITNHISKRSLKTEDKSAFDLLDKMYKTRNNIAHEGRSYFRDPGTEKEVEVKTLLAVEFLKASEKTIEWIKSISK